jgi:hypothetical protein
MPAPARHGERRAPDLAHWEALKRARRGGASRLRPSATRAANAAALHPLAAVVAVRIPIRPAGSIATGASFRCFASLHPR